MGEGEVCVCDLRISLDWCFQVLARFSDLHIDTNGSHLVESSPTPLQSLWLCNARFFKSILEKEASIQWSLGQLYFPPESRTSSPLGSSAWAELVVRRVLIWRTLKPPRDERFQRLGSLCQVDPQ